MKSAWRLFVAAVAAYAAFGWIDGLLSLRTFTVQTNLIIAVTYAGLALRPRARAYDWLRGGVLVTALTLSAIFFAEGGDGTTLLSFVSHLLTTALVLADFLLVDRRQPPLPRWLPVAWLAYPAAYLVMTLIVATFITEPWRKYQYPFLNPTRPGFALRITVFAALILALGYAVLAVSRLRSRPHSPRRPRTSARI